jgi:DNA adenine methylase
MKTSLPKPFLKWAGGKGQIIHELLVRIPKKFNTYHEPFLGGGALFFELYRQGRIRKAILSDLNRELIDTYIALRDSVEQVIALLCSYPYDRDFYYEIRDQDPWRLTLIQRAARMIYLNRTCYNGLYRVNRRGRFNVPFGRYRNPTVCDAENLRAVSKALRDVEIHCEDFARVLERAQAGDFVYFDPPYAPVSETANFTAYTLDGFGPGEQVRLRDVARTLVNRGVAVMVSNSATRFIRQLYHGFLIDEVEVGRPINCRATVRRGWREFIIMSVPNDPHPLFAQT